jgi:hypothetical protein
MSSATALAALSLLLQNNIVSHTFVQRLMFDLCAPDESLKTDCVMFWKKFWKSFDHDLPAVVGDLTARASAEFLPCVGLGPRCAKLP